mgnify:CR=1 FL=1
MSSIWQGIAKSNSGKIRVRGSDKYREMKCFVNGEYILACNWLGWNSKYRVWLRFYDFYINVYHFLCATLLRDEVLYGAIMVRNGPLSP